MSLKCLISDVMHDSIVPLLEGIGLEPVYRPDITRQGIIDTIDQFDGLIIRSKTRIDSQIIEKATRLQFIGRGGAGIDNLDVDIIKKAGIKIFNAPEGNRNAVGEQAVGMLLSLLNKLQKADKEVRNMVWDREGNRGHELLGKTVGLIGCGNMGQSFAQKLSGFGCKVLAYDKYKYNYTDNYVVETTLEDIFKNSDILSLHIPLTKETKGLVNNEFIDRFEKSIYLINTARGEVVETEAIVNGLQSGKLVGAALDVLENEKLTKMTGKQQKSFQYLSNSQKTILTPHVAGWSVESYKMINTVLVDKIREFLKGEI
ncbi:MAG: NAD(P)-dependent oxidoreductase [Bacteroidota bacterium]